MMSPRDTTFDVLSETHMARLLVHLVVPVAVQTICDGTRDLDDPARLALHDLISAQTPDQALLSIALSAMVLDSRLREREVRAAEILSMSAEMMVQDYAPLYLETISKHPNGSLFDRDDIEFLSTIPEDLESLSDLLSVVADVVPPNCRDFRIIADILAVQASAQALIAETLVDTLSEEFDFDDVGGLDENRMVIHTDAPLGDNVVPFRRR